MRDMNECKAEVFRRMEKGIQERKKKRNRFFMYCVPLCLCFAILWVAVIPRFLPNDNLTVGLNGKPESATGTKPNGGKEETVASNHPGTPRPPESNGYIPDIEFDSIENGFMEWNHKTITSSLWEVLSSSAADDCLNIYLTYFVMEDGQDQNFIFQGKTLKAYLEDMDKKNALIEKLALLFKVGDTLKYGEAVYTTGTPTGKKWSKQLYEETVAYIGSELLNRYIINHTFLSENVLADRETAVSDAAVALEEYKKACSECKKLKLLEVYSFLKKQGIPVWLSATGNTLMLSVTKDAFARLEFDHMENLIFTANTYDSDDMI